MRGFFVTGTGTGVGKTHVTVALARRARIARQRVFAFKPIETGCRWVQGVLVGDDQIRLCEAAGDWQRGLLRGVYQFERPVAPAVASSSINLELIKQTLQEGAGVADLTLVEGAGGWKVPITKTANMADLARQSGFPVIVVGLATLGTINHSLLTLESIERTGVSIAGLILSQRPEDDPVQARSNRDEIQARWTGVVALYANDIKALDVFPVER